MRQALFMSLAMLALSAGPGLSQPVVRPGGNANPEIGGKTLDHWIREIEDRDPSVREHAIKMVSMLGPAAKKAVPSLIRQMQVPNDLSPMTNAAIAIGLILLDDPKPPKEAIQGLMSLVGNDQHIIRFQALTSLGNIGFAARMATPRVLQLVRSPFSWEIRKAACYALGRIGVIEDKNTPDQYTADIRALSALTEAVDDVSKEVRVEALQGLINLGPPFSPGDRQVLKEKFEKRIKVDKDKYVGIWVRVALMRMDQTQVNDANLSYISKFLRLNDPPGINADSARALGALGPLAKPKVPDLIDALKSSDTSLVSWACWALGRIGPDAKAALPALKIVSESADTAVKSAAQEAIKAINSPTKR